MFADGYQINISLGTQLFPQALPQEIDPHSLIWQRVYAGWLYRLVSVNVVYLFLFFKTTLVSNILIFCQNLDLNFA